MNFKVGDIIYWEAVGKKKQWKIVQLYCDNEAKIQLISSAYVGECASYPVGTIIDWNIFAAKVLSTPPSKHHPLTDIFK